VAGVHRCGGSAVRFGGDDVALSTAAGLSARFPVVAVAGRIAAGGDRRCAGATDGAVFVVDGGYVEGAGAGTLLDGWYASSDQVDRHNSSGTGACVVPFMLHFDNGYESGRVTGNEAVPREFLVPLLTVFSSSSGITAARADAALAFEHPFTIGGSDVPVLVEEADGSIELTQSVRSSRHPCPPRGSGPARLDLSQASINDLRDQLVIPENAAALEEIRTWLDGELRCMTE
jgi:hypothetical protein